MVIDREVYKQIEYHFYNYEKEKEIYEELADSIANRNSYSVEKSGVHSAMKADGIGDKVIALDKVGSEMKMWNKVVEKTIGRFAYSDSMTKLLKYKYFKNYKAKKIQEMLFISKSTYFGWKDDIITYAAMKASEYKLIVF